MNRLSKQVIFYRDTEDLIRQVDGLLAKLKEKPKLTEYAVVRKRYTHLTPSAYTMRLKRFLKSGGYFPHEMGCRGRKIVALHVTPALDSVLRR